MTLYKRFLENKGGYENIFVSDIRDAIFQKDLFECYSIYKNFLIYATENNVIENDQKWNSAWIKHLFGEEIYQKIKHNIIVCSGTILGSKNEMEIFFVEMMKILFNRNGMGEDQGAMNYLIHEKLLPIENIIASDVNTGEIFTCGVIEGYDKFQDDKILRLDGGIPAVVHQYDRHKVLVELVNKNYREQDFKFDENFTDVHSVADQIMCLMHFQKWSEVTRVFVNYLLNANVQEHGDRILKLCENILSRINNLDFETEILLIAIQKVIISAFSAEVNFMQVERIYAIFTALKNSPVAVNAQFEYFIGQMLAYFANLAYQNQNSEICLQYLDRISTLKIPHDEDFYLFQAKIYRETGNKDKALENYKKALDMS